MLRPLLFAVAFTLFGTCWSFGQDVKNDPQQGKSVRFEGKEAGDRRELVPGIFFRWCPAGTFTMGSPQTEPGRSDNEDQVSVTLTKGYWLGETEVTQGQWQKSMGTTPWSWKGRENERAGDNYAASNISHDVAVKFCTKLTNEERTSGRLTQSWKYSMPTEAQWEYACRAGTTTRFSFGDDETYLNEYEWFTKNAWDIGDTFAHEVGLKKPNPWGFRDMHGNVREWCADWYDDLQGGQDPEGPSTGSDRVNRGGGLHSDACDCRSARRRLNSSDLVYSLNLGFRLAVVQE